MTVQITPVSNEPILIAKYIDPLDAVADSQTTNDASEELAAQIPTGPIHVIADLTEAHITFTTLVQGLAQASRGKSAAMKNPRVKMLIVGSGAMIDFAVNAARQAQYGNNNATLFNDVDAAIQYARSRQTEAVS